MDIVPNWLAGATTIAALIAFGIFLYPWLLTKRRGHWLVAIASAGLVALYAGFDRRSDSAAVSLLLASLWALAPVVAGVIVYRLQSRRS